ncbi:hypothetical protein AVEN_177823-1 [Araneus ventricosus]|uniref:Uncharacterized protein n=1 Tax=Araneus ventricosus TaxID=182803 RepID=A0A4Y2Q8Q7_ARAVE|nr:hypothetical protein AVEN_177823-1 [Araneus ventricosus]
MADAVKEKTDKSSLKHYYVTMFQPEVQISCKKIFSSKLGFPHCPNPGQPGSLNFTAMRELSIRSVRCFILVFSVNLDNMQSFHEAMQLWDLIQQIRGEAALSFCEIAFFEMVSSNS